MYQKTEDEIKEIRKSMRTTFIDKNKDYGPNWIIMRPMSLLEQVFIKIQRIIEIQNKGVQKVEDSIEGDLMGIINYCIMFLFKMDNSITFSSYQQKSKELTEEILLKKYDSVVKSITELRIKKNHDYGEAWRDMRVSSLTDLIAQKYLRVYRMLEKPAEESTSEPYEENVKDMCNYAFFILILLEKQKNNEKK